MTNKKYFIGIDLGGTGIKCGIVNEKGEILLKKSVPTCAEKGGIYVVNSMCELVLSVMKEYKITFDDVVSIGIGCPGSVDKEKGSIIYTNNIDMDNLPVRNMMQEYFNRNVDIYVDNDARCALWAEKMAGSAKDKDSAVMVTLGTGVGGGIILKGKLWGGFNGCGGEIGHTVIEKGGIECNCGRKGCWEGYSSATALIRMTKEEAEKNKDSLMWKEFENAGKWNGRIAFVCANKGDKSAIKTVNKYIEYLSLGIANMINIFQPEVLIVGGGISNQGENLLVPVREQVSKLIYTKDSEVKQTEIVKAVMGNDAGIIGAGLLNE